MEFDKGELMRKKTIFLSFIILLLLQMKSSVIAVDNSNKDENTLNQDDIISSQKASLNVGEFISEAKKYTQDVFEDTDYNELLNSAIKGDIDNGKIGKSILNIARKRNNRFY